MSNVRRLLMSWPQVIAISALLIGLGKFIDNYHQRARAENKLVGWTRSALVALFMKLDEVKPLQIASRVLKVPIWLAAIVVVLTAFLVFNFGAMVLGLATMLAKVPFSPTLLMLCVGVSVVIQILVFLVMRLIARYANDLTATVALFIFPHALYAGTLAPLALVGDSAPLGIVWLLLALFVVANLAIVPAIIVTLAALATMLLKYVTLALRWLAMHIADAASSPTISPFSYFSSLWSALLLSYKALAVFV